MKLSDLIEWYNSTDIPERFELRKGQTITNVRNFAESHIAYLKANPGNKRYLPYFERLVEVRELILKKPSK